MRGTHNSVLSRLKEKQPDIFFLHCICHSAHLCASGACKKLPRNVEKLVQQIYFHFKSSPKRRERYHEFQHFVDVAPHTLLAASQTRWLSLQMCVSRTLEQWAALKSYFLSAEDEVTADTIGEELSSDLNYAYFLFLDTVLPLFTKFNVLFQAEKTVIHMLYSECQLLFQQFISSYVKAEVIDSCITVVDVDFANNSNHLSQEDIFVGRKTRMQLETMDDLSLVGRFFSSVVEFYVEATIQLKKRLPLSNSTVRALSVLDPKQRKKFATLNLLPTRFPNLVDEEKLDDLDLEWREFRHMDLMDLESLDVDQFWNEIACLKKVDGQARFSILPQLMKCLLALPHTSADAERVFSQLTLIKTKQRNRIGNELLNSLLTVKCNTHTPCYNFKPTERMIDLACSSDVLYADTACTSSDPITNE